MHVRLTPDHLLPAKPLTRLGTRVFTFDEIDSTNAWLLREARTLPDGTLVTAEFQSAGRGRLGRRWAAPRGSSILLSALIREPATSTAGGSLTMAALVATAEAVEQATSCHPAIRWPNDLESGGRKLAGVLVEARGGGGDVEDRVFAVGIGLNCLQQAGHFAAELRELATSLDLESPVAIDRVGVAQALVRRLDAWIALATRSSAGRAELLSAWKARCDDFGRRVTLGHDRREFTGTALDLNEQGELLLQPDYGPRRYFAPTTTTRFR
jgi:BirA family biotin operon repressor/biotin-[acetyl-CoA-carboxylase] ligase